MTEKEIKKDNMEKWSKKYPKFCEKLKEKGYDSYYKIAVADAEMLSLKLGIGQGAAKELIKQAKDEGGLEMKENMENAVKEAELLIEEVNTILNKAIAKSRDSEGDRRILRQIRDNNIRTYLKIQELEMRGLL